MDLLGARHLGHDHDGRQCVKHRIDEPPVHKEFRTFLDQPLASPDWSKYGLLSRAEVVRPPLPGAKMELAEWVWHAIAL
jgi:hypothetical protein